MTPLLSYFTFAVVQFLQHQGAKKLDVEIAELQEIRVAQTMAILSEFRTGLKEDFTEHLRELVRNTYTVRFKAGKIAQISLQYGQKCCQKCELFYKCQRKTHVRKRPKY